MVVIGIDRIRNVNEFGLMGIGVFVILFTRDARALVILLLLDASDDAAKIYATADATANDELFIISELLTRNCKASLVFPVCLAYPISWVLASTVFMIAYLRGTWLRKRIAICGMEPEIRS